MSNDKISDEYNEDGDEGANEDRSEESEDEILEILSDSRTSDEHEPKTYG
jgi:hypothetical protein